MRMVIKLTQTAESLIVWDLKTDLLTVLDLEGVQEPFGSLFLMKSP